MTILLLLAVLLMVLVALALVGMRSRAIFTNPGALPDRQVEATIELTRAIMRRSRPGSTTWTRAAARHKAAVDEQLRRRGERPHDNIEIVNPDP